MWCHLDNHAPGVFLVVPSGNQIRLAGKSPEGWLKNPRSEWRFNSIFRRSENHRTFNGPWLPASHVWLPEGMNMVTCLNHAQSGPKVTALAKMRWARQSGGCSASQNAMPVRWRHQPIASLQYMYMLHDYRFICRVWYIYIYIYIYRYRYAF